MQRQCRTCEEVKPLEDYYNCAKGKDGKHSECKECLKVRSKRWQIANPERYRKTATRFYHNNKDVVRQRINAWEKRNKEKRAAHVAVRRAVKNGDLVPQDCEHCGSRENIQGHHEDYSKPLVVVWLCCRCHNKHHAREREVALEL